MQYTDRITDMIHDAVTLLLYPLVNIASLEEWLRLPPRERKNRGSIPACAVGIFPGRVIPET